MSISPLAVFSASMLHGTARGEIQLLTARCIAGSLIPAITASPLLLEERPAAASRRMGAGSYLMVRDARRRAPHHEEVCVRVHILNDEFEGVAVAPDVAGVEMSADHQRRS